MHPSDIDPSGARSVEEFAELLRRVRARADKTSYRDLERWGRQHGVPLPRSTLADVLAGRRLPRKPMLRAFLTACGIDPSGDLRWDSVWNRLAEDVAGHDATQAGVTRREGEALRTVADRESLQRDAQLEADTAAAGLLRVGANYLNELEWDVLFTDVRELDIFVAYGQTWRNLHARYLHQLAHRGDARIRVFLPDPTDEATVSVLADRFAITSAELTRRIEATRDEYQDIRQHGGASIEIYFRRGDRVFSFYRLDRVAVVGFYSHRRSHNRLSAVPVFVCTAPGSLYEFIADELQEIVAQSRLAPAT